MHTHLGRLRTLAGSLLAASTLLLAATSAQAALLTYSFSTGPDSSYSQHYAYTYTCLDGSYCSAAVYLRDWY